MTSGIQLYPPADRTYAPLPLQAPRSTTPHPATVMSTAGRPLGLVEHCPGRAPGHTCYQLHLPGYPTCPGRARVDPQLPTYLTGSTLISKRSRFLAPLVERVLT